MDFNSENNSTSVLYYYSGDFENNGQTESFAFVGNPKSVENVSHTITASVWYVDKNGAQKILEEKSYFLNPNVVVSNNKTILIVEEYNGGSGSISYAFTVNNGDPVQTKNIGEGLKLATNASDSDFYIIKPGFDNRIDYTTLSDGTKSEQNTGHTYKRYYLYFDGTSFKEYGGIKITQSQLESAKGGNDVVSSIKKAGYQIGNIFYRANGIININCSKTSSNGDSTDNENLTLQYNDGSVNYVYGSEISYSNDYVKNSSYGGIYEAAINPSIATYPSSFPQ